MEASQCEAGAPSSLEIAQISKALAEREAQLTTLRSEVQRLETELAQRNARINDLWTDWRSLRELRTASEVRAAKISERVSTQLEQLRECAVAIAALTRHGEEQASVITARERQIADLEAQILELRGSVSWKLAAPLRRILDAVAYFTKLLYCTPVFRWTGKPLAKFISSVGFSGASLLLPRNPLFDGRFYLEQNEDASRSNNPWAHYLAFGADERRDPHPLFDTSFYLESYPDVIASGLNPLIHYLEYGASEGRKPHVDFENMPGRMNPLLDFWRYGRNTGSQASLPPSTLLDCPDTAFRKPGPVQASNPPEESEVAMIDPGEANDENADGPLPVDSPVKLIAFFLPQFYPVKENDEFWGKGFTEWMNVTRAKPNFEGHYQPQLPADLGYYDLRVPEVLEQQAELASSHGIHGFCFYYYWFKGRRLLERPLDQMLRSGRPDFPFCICWANENWTRTWDGARNEVLIHQDYSEDACEQFIRDVIPILRDPRYIRVDGAPMLLVYRINTLPQPATITKRWREICAAEGISSLHICAVQSFGIGDPRPYGCDAAIEFPPHTDRVIVDRKSFPGIAPDFQGYLEHYPTIARNQLALPWPDYTWYRGVMPSFDNTPRRGIHAHIYVNSGPRQYESWLYELVKQGLSRKATQEPILFINAWNEWAEGAYLEPDQKYGRARLLATSRALVQATKDFGCE